MKRLFHFNLSMYTFYLNGIFSTQLVTNHHPVWEVLCWVGEFSRTILLRDTRATTLVEDIQATSLGFFYQFMVLLFERNIPVILNFEKIAIHFLFSRRWSGNTPDGLPSKAHEVNYSLFTCS